MGEMVLSVDRGDISYIRYILEGYDGLGTVTTVDSRTAMIMLSFPLSRKDLITRLVHALEDEGVLREDNIK
jgi:hypothetical protein